MDWLISFEAKILEGLEGRRAFPLTFALDHIPRPDEVEAARELVQRYEAQGLAFEYLPAPEDPIVSPCLVVRAEATDPNPPPGLEGHPAPLWRMVE